MLKPRPFSWPSTKEKSNSLASLDWHRWSWMTSIEHRGVSGAPRCARPCWTSQHGVVVTVSFVLWWQLEQIRLREKLICRFGRNSHGLMQHGWPEQLFAYKKMYQKMPHVFVGRKHLRSFHLAAMFLVLVARGVTFRISTLVGCPNWFAHDAIWLLKIIPWNSWHNVAASFAVTGHLPGYLNRTVKVVTVAVAWTRPKPLSASTVDGHLQSHELQDGSHGSHGPRTCWLYAEYNAGCGWIFWVGELESNFQHGKFKQWYLDHSSMSVFGRNREKQRPNSPAGFPRVSFPDASKIQAEASRHLHALESYVQFCSSWNSSFFILAMWFLSEI